MKKALFFGVIFLFAIAWVLPAVANDEYVGIGAQLQPWGSWKVTETESDLPEEQQRELENQLNEDEKISRVLISGLVCDGPAAKAGLKKGDIVIAVNNYPLHGITDSVYRALIAREISSFEVGDSVKLTIKRKSLDKDDNLTYDEFDVKIVLKKIPKKFDCE